MADAGEGFLGHPSLVSANRVRLAALVASNSLGQNAPAIMAESHYAEMWAQDVSAMRADEGSAAAEAKVQMKATVVLENVDAAVTRTCPGSADAFKLLTTLEKKKAGIRP